MTFLNPVAIFRWVNGATRIASCTRSSARVCWLTIHADQLKGIILNRIIIVIRHSHALSSYHHHASSIKSNQLSTRVNSLGRSAYSRPKHHYSENSVRALSTPLHILDFSSIARTLRGATLSSGEALCPVPDRLAELVRGFCRTYHNPSVHRWSCDELPCELLKRISGNDQDQYRGRPLRCPDANGFEYTCVTHTSLMTLLLSPEEMSNCTKYCPSLFDTYRYF